MGKEKYLPMDALMLCLRLPFVPFTWRKAASGGVSIEMLNAMIGMRQKGDSNEG